MARNPNGKGGGSEEKIYVDSEKKIILLAKQGFYSNELRTMGFDFDIKYDALIDSLITNDIRRLKLISIIPEHKIKINYAFNKISTKKETKLTTLIKLRILSGLKDHCRQNKIFIKSMCIGTLEQIIGYPINDLILYLNIKKYEDILTKEIDHIIPKSKLKFSSFRDENFIKCWELSNLRLISRKENREKWNRYAA